MNKCESRLADDSPCLVSASWAVQAGNRVSDRTLACGRHFNQVCWAMVNADAPRTVTLHVSPVGGRREHLGEA